MDAEAFQFAAVAVVAAVWFVADGHSRRMRRQAKRYREDQVQVAAQQPRRLMDVGAPPNSDD